MKNKPEMYKKVQDKYDPEGIYAKQYKAQLEAEGIKIPVWKVRHTSMNHNRTITTNESNELILRCIWVYE